MINVNEDYFREIDTEEKAYWLGFIWADGYVAQKAPWFLCVQIKDHDHLEKFASSIEYRGEIKFPKYSGAFAGSTQQSRLTICRKSICDRLNLLGKNNKDFSIPDINPDLIRHFLRGFFDGDGGLSRYIKNTTKNRKIYSYDYLEVFFTCNLTMMESIKELFNTLDIKYSIKKSKTEWIKYISIQKKESVSMLYMYMYENSNINLERKYIKWKHYYSSLDEKSLLNNPEYAGTPLEP